MSTLSQKFKKFHQDNPYVYDMLVSLTLDAKNKGMKKVGIAMLWEVLRWELINSTNGNEKYKLNNDYKSRYARLIMENEKELEGIFDLRGLKTI